MKNKRGFTLIEIIICIGLIAIIGTSITVVSIKNLKENKTNRLEKLHNQILEAANVFLSIEKDDSSENYETVINSGAKGVKIPISYLVEKGYVSKETVDEVYKLNELDSSKNYYVLAVNGGEEDTQDYCEVGNITFSLSYMVENKPVYLCKNYKKYINTTVETITNIQEIQNNVRLKVSLNKNAVSENYYNSLSDDNKNNFTKDENGIFTLYDENVDKVYTYYRGSVDYNYLKLGKDSEGNDLIWRIVYLDDTKKAKLVLDQEIPISLKGEYDNKTLFVEKGDSILYLNATKINAEYYVFNGKLEDDIRDTTYKCKKNGECNQILKYKYYDLVSPSSLYSTMNFAKKMTYDSNDGSNIYYKKLKEWYDTTNLNTYSTITNNNNFCKNDFYKTKDYYNYTYKPNNTFACVYAHFFENTNSKLDYNNSDLFYSSPVGFLTYGDVVRAGLYEGDDSNNLINSGSYLLKSSENAYPLVDLKLYYADHSNNESVNIYYVDINGLKSGGIYDATKYDYDTRRACISIYNSSRDVFDVGTPINNCIEIKGKNSKPMKEFIFKANTIKPSIIIDLSDKKLSGDGTINNMFEVVDKN